MHPVLRALSWRGTAALRTLRGLRQRDPLLVEDVELMSTAGYRLVARRVRPSGAGRLPGVVVSPAIHQGVDALLGTTAVVNAMEIAALGYTVLIHDPAGRGGSWGEEDFGGTEHQDDLRVAIRALAADPSCTGRVGVLALSLGIAAAVGALTGDGQALPVDWLVDWEGPCDREIITAGGTMLVPAAGHTLDDEAWWRPREAVRGAAALTCGYVRLQAFPDHAQPDELRHSRRMITAAAAGKLPWLQLNDHPRGERPERPHWIAGGPRAANQAILSKLRALRGAEHV